MFLGTLIPEDADIPRASLLNHLIKETDVNVKLYGPKEGWELAGMVSQGPKYGTDAYAAMVAGDIVLSLSRAQPNVTMYRSERLTGKCTPQRCQYPAATCSELCRCNALLMQMLRVQAPAC